MGSPKGKRGSWGGDRSVVAVVCFGGESGAAGSQTERRRFGRSRVVAQRV
jgi:hypothetical protein